MERLQQLGSLEIVSSAEGAKALAEAGPEPVGQKDGKKKEHPSFLLAEISFAQSFLRKFAPKSSFVQSLLPRKLKPFKAEALERLAKAEKIKETAKSCAVLEAKLNELKTKQERVREEIKILERFVGVKAALPQKGRPEGFEYRAGYLRQERRPALLRKLKEKRVSFSIEWGPEQGGEFSFVLIYPKKDAPTLLPFWKDYVLREEEIFWPKAPEELLWEKRALLAGLEREARRQQEKARGLTKTLPELEAVSDWCRWELEKQHFFHRLSTTQSYVVITAWAPKEALASIKEELKKISPYFLLRELPLKKGEQPPVMLKNRAWVSFFEPVTNIYGRPKFNEPDPTPYLAPFFAVSFAFALSDTGYGLVLAAAAWAAKKLLRAPGFKPFFNLMIAGGSLTFLAGLFAGTVFGTEIAAGLRILDPLKDPVKTLIFILLWGALQLFVGLMIGLVWEIRRGRVREAIAQKGGMMMVFLGILLSLLTHQNIFALLGLLLLVLAKIVFSAQRRIVLRIGAGLGSLYGLVGYLSDILSYSRLLALGLATGIIAMVVNMIAFLFKEMIPVPLLDRVIQVLILLGGHTFNLLINTLGAFIHSARLQFVEFFPKFMEGGGRHLKPFEKRGQFVSLAK